jgi:hypothetical protein
MGGRLSAIGAVQPMALSRLPLCAPLFLGNLCVKSLSPSGITYANACLKSSIKSPASSNPIETRTVPGSTPAARNSANDIR